MTEPHFIFSCFLSVTFWLFHSSAHLAFSLFRGIRCGCLVFCAGEEMPFCPKSCFLLDLNSFVHSVSNIHYFSRWSAFLLRYIGALLLSKFYGLESNGDSWHRIWFTTNQRHPINESVTCGYISFNPLHQLLMLI